MAFIADVEKVYSSITQTPPGVSVIPLFRTADAPIPKDTVFEEVFIMTNPRLDEFAEMAAPEEVPAVYEVGAEAVKASLELVKTAPVDETTATFPVSETIFTGKPP